MNKNFFIILGIIFLVSLGLAAAQITPSSFLNGYDQFWIKDYTTISGANITADTFFFGDGSHISNINSTGIAIYNSTYNTWSYNQTTPAKSYADTLAGTANLHNHTWANLSDYPIACPAGSYITQLNDSVTCSAITEIPNNINITNGNLSIGETDLYLDIYSNSTYIIFNNTLPTIFTGNLSSATGFSGTCLNITYQGGIAISCND